MNLFQYIILVDIYTENSVLQKHVIGKVNSTLIAFSEIGGCYCLILYQNLTSSSFLKVNCIMQLERISTSWQQQASSYSVTLKSMYIFWTLIRSDQISRSVMSDSLWPHELQHARPPCPSPTPRVHSDSRPSSVHGVLKARVLKWFAIPFSSGPHSVRPLHHDPPVLGGPTGMA